MRGIGGLSWLIKDYADRRNGRIEWKDYLDLWIGSEGKRQRCLRRIPGGTAPFDEMEQVGRKFALFRGRSAACHNLDKWGSDFPVLNGDKTFPYVTVPAKDCKTCEFHEPANRYSRKRRYAACKWFRENSEMKSPLELYLGAVSKAADMLK